MSNIKTAVTKKASDDAKKYPIIQVAYMERIGDVAMCEQYGIHGNPPVGTPCILLTVNGDESNRFVIPLSATHRTKRLAEGEVEVGNYKVGSIITFDKDGNINVVAQNNVDVDAVGDVLVDCGGDLVATVGQNAEINAMNGQVDINSPDIILNGRVLVKKNLTVKDEDIEGSELNGIVNNLGTISGVGNVQSQGVDLATHIHTGVTPGSGVSGPPA